MLRPSSHRMRSTSQHAHANNATPQSMGVFTQLAINIKGFVQKLPKKNKQICSCVLCERCLLAHTFCGERKRTHSHVIASFLLNGINYIRKFLFQQIIFSSIRMTMIKCRKLLWKQKAKRKALTSRELLRISPRFNSLSCFLRRLCPVVFYLGRNIYSLSTFSALTTLRWNKYLSRNKGVQRQNYTKPHALKPETFGVIRGKTFAALTSCRFGVKTGLYTQNRRQVFVHYSFSKRLPSLCLTALSFYFSAHRVPGKRTAEKSVLFTCEVVHSTLEALPSC